MRAEVGSGDFQKPPEGLTIGRCYRVIDLGTQEKKYKGNVDYCRQLLVHFELPMHMIDVETDEGVKRMPMSASKKYRLSFNAKAALRKDMEAWYGKKFNDKDIEAAGGFDPSKILGRPGQILIEHNGDYANIEGLMPLAQGQTCPDQFNESFIFDLDEFDPAKWEQLSQKMQQWIAKSPEAQEVLKAHYGNTQSQQQQSEAPQQPSIDDGFDDIPF